VSPLDALSICSIWLTPDLAIWPNCKLRGNSPKQLTPSLPAVTGVGAPTQGYRHRTTKGFRCKEIEIGSGCALYRAMKSEGFNYA